MAEAVGALDESFLPQIIGIFYATFHPKQGPIVPYKVPENLISHNEQGFESSQGPNSRRGSFDPNSLLSSTSQAPNRSADELEDDGLLQEDVLAFRRGSIARRSTTGKSEDGKEDSRLLKPDETPISSTSRDSSLSSHPNWVQTPSATSTAPTTSLSYSLQEASPTAFPTVPEPLLSARSSLHTCSAPGSAITSREQSPSVPIPSLPSGDASKALVTADDARAKRLGAFTSNKVREADTYPLHAGNGYCGPRSSLDESDASDREDAHGRGRPTAVQNMIRCASESPSSGLERTGHHQSHIHVVNIASTTHSSSDSTLINGIGEDSRRRGSFGQLVSASLDSRRRLASRSRTRATGGTAAAAAAGPGNGGARTSSVSPNRLGRFRGMRSSSPAGIQGSYRVPSTSASAGGRDMSMQAATGPQTLLDFSQISEYIIGKSALKHRLVTCVLGNYRILSFPCVIEDERYPRNQFIWNLAFVFDRRSDLSGFEPVVRKCGRIFRACELDSQYLTQRSTRANIQNVIDQMFEDLNSYSETSITIDGINYLELKLFPFYPNPPAVEDWHVPVPLIDFGKVRDDNWDITAQRVSEHINGVNHVSRIAELADADIDCVRLCVQHFLYYQVIMMIDIFQYSNMYTVKPLIQKMSRDASVSAECGVYITRPDYQQPSWPVLLELYSALRPGVTVHQWAIDNAQAVKGIDIRRFITFGIIKGFVRRVHRWPIMEECVVTAPPSVSVGGGGQESGMDSMISRISSDNAPHGQGQMADRMRQGQRKRSTSQTQWTSFSDRHSQQNLQKEDAKTSGMTIWSAKSTDSLLLSNSPREGFTHKTRSGTNNPQIRRESATSGLTSGFMRIPGTGAGTPRGFPTGVGTETRSNQASHAYIQPSSMAVAPSTSVPSNSHLSSHQGSYAGQGLSTSHATNNSLALRPPSSGSTHGVTGSGSRRHTGPGPASAYGTNVNANAYQSGGSGQGYNSRRTAGLNNRYSSRLFSPQRQSHLSFKSYQNQSIEEQEAQIKEELKPYLDGTHHTDEIQVKFKMPWKRLDTFLRRIALEAEDAWDYEGRGWASGASATGAEWSETKRKEKAEAVERGDYGKVVIVLR